MQKSGELQRKREKHLQRQANSEAMKRLRLGDTVEMTALYNDHFRRVRVSPLPKDVTSRNLIGNVLCLIRRTLCVAWAYEKDCQPHIRCDGNILPLSQVYGYAEILPSGVEKVG